MACPHCGSKTVISEVENKPVKWCPECAWDEEIDGHRPLRTQYLEVPEVAKTLEVSTGTVFRLIKDGTIPANTRKEPGRGGKPKYIIADWIVERLYWQGWGI